MKHAVFQQAESRSGRRHTDRIQHGEDPRGGARGRAFRSFLTPVLLVAAVFASACSETPVSPEGAGMPDSPQFTVGAGPVVQHLSVGSNDLCPALGQPPGCDANFTLVANKWANGTVQGQ